MNKPREWWIEFGGDPSDDVELYKRYVSGTAFDTVSSNVIQVIEKSAYDNITTKYDKLIQNLKNVSGCRYCGYEEDIRKITEIK